MTPGEQVRAKGLAVLTAMDPEREPEPKSSSAHDTRAEMPTIQQTIAESQHRRHTDRMLNRLRDNNRYAPPRGTRIPAANYLDEERVKDAYNVLFSLADSHNVPVTSISTINEALLFGHEAVRFYEDALLRVDQHLHERTELQELLHEARCEVESLTDQRRQQDEHNLAMTLQIQELGRENHELSCNNGYEQDDRRSLEDTVRELDEKCRRETATLVRQKDAAYRERDNAIEKFTIERRAYQDEANGLRANLRLAEAQRDAWQENHDELSSSSLTIRPDVLLRVQNRVDVLRLENENLRNSLRRAELDLEQTTEIVNVRRREYNNLSGEYQTVCLRMAQTESAIAFASEQLAAEEEDARNNARSSGSIRSQRDRLRSSSGTQTNDPDQDTQSESQNSFLLVGQGHTVPATSSTIREEMEEPDEEAREEV